MSSNAEKVTRYLPEFFFEKGKEEHRESVKESLPDIKLDKHGLPLLPQPSNHEDDPLVSLITIYRHSSDPLLTSSPSELVPTAQALGALTSSLSLPRWSDVISRGKSSVCPNSCCFSHYPSSGVLRTCRICEHSVFPKLVTGNIPRFPSTASRGLIQSRLSSPDSDLSSSFLLPMCTEEGLYIYAGISSPLCQILWQLIVQHGTESCAYLSFCL